MRVLVTGATGFLGTRLVHQLLQAGIEVRALVRKSSDISALKAMDVELVTGSLEPAENLEAAVQGVDAVAHCAGGGWARNVQDMYDNNLGTTANLLKALEGTRLSRFVFVSSLAAHGPSPTGDPRDPSEPAAPITHYGRAKAEAEQLVLSYGDRFPVTLIRPPAIYGPGDVRLLPVFKCASRGFVPLPRAGRSTSLIHVEDCAAAIALVLQKPHPTRRTYFVEDGQIQSLESMALLIGEAVKRKPRILRLPHFVLYIAALISEGLGKLRRRAVLLNRDKVRDLQQAHWVCDSSPIRAELGWAPRVPFEEGVRATAQWYREHEWLA
jgi:nucleoside-diphosphate-sugar epimerase